MAKFEHPSDDTIKLVNDVFLTVVEERYGVNAKILVNNEQKEIGKLKKLSSDIKFSYGDDLQITINENVLDRLPPIEQNMCIEELLCGVHFDAENEKLVIDSKDVQTYHGFLGKHGYPKYQVMIESVKTIYEVIKQEEKEEKERLKASGNE